MNDKNRSVITERHNYMKSSKAIDAANLIEVPDAIDVYSWSPEPAGSVNPKITQVHMHIGTPSSRAKFMVRFKGPDTLDALIESLIEHRTNVWGKP